MEEGGARPCRSFVRRCGLWREGIGGRELEVGRGSSSRKRRESRRMLKMKAVRRDRGMREEALRKEGGGRKEDKDDPRYHLRMSKLILDTACAGGTVSPMSVGVSVGVS